MRINPKLFALANEAQPIDVQEFDERKVELVKLGKEKGQITYYAGRRTNADLINCIASITNGNDGQCLDINEDGYADASRGISFVFNYTTSKFSPVEDRTDIDLLYFISVYHFYCCITNPTLSGLKQHIRNTFQFHGSEV